MRNLILCLLAAVTASLVGVAPAQSGYAPGQTFNAGSPRPAPSQTPVPQQRVQPTPQYTPRPQPARPRSTQPPLYNTGKAPGSSRNASKSAPAKARLAGSEKPAIEKPTSKTSAPPAAKATVPVESPTADATPVAPEIESTVVATASKPAATTTGPLPLVINNIKTGKNLVALTYDDGPNPNLTPQLLKYLSDNKVPATFFVCGNMVKNRPAMVKEIHDMGFELANHTYDHPMLVKLSREKIVEQLQDTHDLVKNASTFDMTLMRPPGGAHNALVREVCQAMGYKVVMWDVDTNDWKKRPAAQMINTIMKGTTDGSIILMHDRLHGSTDTVLPTTRAVVDQLRAKGYTFVTVGQMIAAREGAAPSTAVAGPANVPIATPAPVSSTTSATLSSPISPSEVVDILPAPVAQ